MAQDGLFGGLRFSDVILPLVGTAAASYSPYLARGLQTGMGLFNSLANFQNSARYWQHLRSEREREDELAKTAQLGMDPVIEEIIRRQRARRGELEQGVRGEDIVRFTQAQGGLPDAISPEIFERGVAGPPNLEQLTEQAASGDDLSNALRLYETQLGAYRAGLPLSPGASISGAGTLAQQLMGSDLDMRQIDETNKLWEEQELRRLRGAAIDRSENLAATREQARIWGEKKKADLGEALRYAQEVANVYDKPLEAMDEVDLYRGITRYSDAIANLSIKTFEDDPVAIRTKAVLEAGLIRLQNELERKRGQGGGTGGGTGGRNLRYVPGVGLVDESQAAPQPGQMIPGH